jgi:hypothetical protein
MTATFSSIRLPPWTLIIGRSMCAALGGLIYLLRKLKVRGSPSYVHQLCPTPTPHYGQSCHATDLASPFAVNKCLITSELSTKAPSFPLEKDKGFPSLQTCLPPKGMCKARQLMASSTLSFRWMKATESWG